MKSFFAELREGNCLMESIEEKHHAALLFMRMQELAAKIQSADPITSETIRASAASDILTFGRRAPLSRKCNEPN